MRKEDVEYEDLYIGISLNYRVCIFIYKYILKPVIIEQPNVTDEGVADPIMCILYFSLSVCLK